MPYRILEYEIEIMKSAIDIKKVKNKEYKLPLVIPIVLYTGKKKWDAKRYLEESQEKLDGVKIKAGNYNLVDINDFTKEELLQEKTLISKMMLLEKSESTEESIEMLEKIIPAVVIMLSLSSVVLRSGTYHFAIGDDSARLNRNILADNGKSFCFRTLFADNGIFAYNCVAVNNGILDNGAALYRYVVHQHGITHNCARFDRNAV